MRTVTRGRTLATLALAATIVAACSSGSGATTAPSAAASTPAASVPAASVPAASAPAGSAPASAAAGGLDCSPRGRGHGSLRRLPEHHPRARPGAHSPTTARSSSSSRTPTSRSPPFNSGTPAVEALLSDAIDITYIGPNPAINAFAKSNGEAVRVISGSTSGGAFLVVKPEINERGRPQGQEDRHARSSATPRTSRSAAGSRSRACRPTPPAAATSRSCRRTTPRRSRRSSPARSTAPGSPSRGRPGWSTEGGGKVLVDERDLWPDGKYVTTHLHRRARSSSRPTPTSSSGSSLANIAGRSTSSTTDPAEAQAIVNAEIEKITTKKLEPDDLLDRGLGQPHLHRRPDRVLAPEVGERRRARSACSRTRATSPSIYDLDAAQRAPQAARASRRSRACETREARHSTGDPTADPTSHRRRPDRRRPGASPSVIDARDQGLLGAGPARVTALDDISLRVAPRRVRVPARRVGLRQAHAAQPRRRPRPPDRRRRVDVRAATPSFMFQEAALFPWLTRASATSSCRCSLRRSRRPSAAQRVARAARAWSS